jgi:ACS family hexuronate transporter-like MFS transporter
LAVVEKVKRYRWVILVLAFNAQFGNALPTASVYPLAPLIQSDVGLTNAEVGLFSSAVFAGTWGVLIIMGSLTDRVGVRRMMPLGQAITGMVILGISMVGGFIQMLLVMFAAGLGRGISHPGISKSIMDWFPTSSRATAMGIKQAGVPAAGIATAAILPTIGLMIGWRYAIAVVGVLIILFGVATALLYRDPSPSGDVPVRGAKPKASIGTVIRNRALWAISFISILYVIVQLGLSTYLALYLNEVVLVTAFPDENARLVAAGGFLAVCQAGGVFGRVFWGVVSDRLFHGRRMLVLTIIGAMAATLSWVTSSFGPGTPIGLLGPIAFMYGASAIGWNGLAQAVIVEAVGKRNAATGVGVSTTFSQIGTVTGAPLFGFVVDVTGTYRAAWMLLGFLSLGGMLMSILGSKTERCVE